MRNLKKVLGLILCLAMMLSLMVVGAGAAFIDQSDIDDVHQDAVNMCVSLSIIDGFEDGSFQPNGNVTREQMAKMICVLDNGGKDPQGATGNTFTDVPADRWSNKYVESCNARGVVSGVGDNKFDPASDVTATQAAKMLLVELGYDADFAKYEGDQWATYVNIDATKKGYYEDLEDIDVTAPMSREHAAQMIWNALQATEVDYKDILVTDPVTGQLTSKVDVYDTGLELIADKYGATVKQGYLINTSYNSTKDEYTYKFASEKFNGDPITTGKDGDYFGASIKGTQDYSDLFGMKVKVVSKGDKLYGITAFESEVLASGLVADLPTDISATAESVKIDGTSYDLDEAASATPIYAFNDDTGVASGLVGYNSAKTGYFEYKLIDNNDDGKANVMVVCPVTIGQITYLNGDKFTVKSCNNSTTAKTGDVEMYDGAAKDDYVVITAAKNTLGTKDVYTKLDTVISGDVSATKDEGKNFTVDGTAYDVADATVTIDGSAIVVAAGDTVKEAAIYNNYAFYVDKSSAVNAEDYVLVIGFKAADGINPAQVKLLFTDGSEKVVDLDKDAKNYSSITANSVGSLFTYEADKDKYTLTPAITVQDPDNKNGESGFDQVVTGEYKYAKDGKSTIKNNYIDPAAVIFVKDGDDYKVVTGEKFAKSAQMKINNAYANENSSSGYTTVMLAYAEGTVSSDNIKYGYVVSDVSSVKNDDGDKVLSFTIFDGEKDVDVQTVKADFTTYSTGKDTLVKGNVISYTEDDGAIDIDTRMVLDKSSVGAVTAYNGSDEFSFIVGTISETITKVAKDVINKTGTENANIEIGDDTVIICVDNDEVEGLPGGKMELATKTPGSNYYANVFVLLSDDGKTADLIVYGNDILNQM